ncbi:MAG: hypothetical protein ACREVJ_10905, partial [Gammaproteobacteria bacterium]
RRIAMIGLVRRAWLALGLTLVWLPITGYTQGNNEPLRVRLVHQRVVTDADGGERYVPAEHAKPGDLIEYRATYANQVPRNLSGVLATLPIPAGMVYAPADITPEPALASLDGARFEPVPIKRMVRNPDGTKALKEVPLEEYQALRWTLNAIRAGQAKTVRARMRIQPTAPPIVADTRTR